MADRIQGDTTKGSTSETLNAAYNPVYTPSPDDGQLGSPPAYSENPAAYPVNQAAVNPGSQAVYPRSQPVYPAYTIPEPRQPTQIVVQTNVSTNNMVRQAEPLPPNYMVNNLLVCLFCSLLFGLIGLFKSSKVKPLYVSGHYAASRQASLSALKWFKVGLYFGIFWKCFLVGYFTIVAIFG